MIHLIRKKECIKSAVFYNDDLICSKCGRVIGFRYRDPTGHKVFLFEEFNKYRHFLNPYFEIPNLTDSEPTISINMGDIHSEIISEAKMPLNIKEENTQIQDEKSL